MDNFTIHRPTKFVFGRDSENQLGILLKKVAHKGITAQRRSISTETAPKGIKALEDFLKSMGMSLNFKKLEIDPKEINKFTTIQKANKGDVIGNYQKLILADAKNIY